MAKLISVSEADFQEKVLQSKQTVLVDFWAEWCGPCRMIAPILEEIAEELDDKLVIAKVDVDQANDIASQYGIRSIPTLILFKDGKQLDVMFGAGTKTQIMKFLSSYL